MAQLVFSLSTSINSAVTIILVYKSLYASLITFLEKRSRIKISRLKEMNIIEILNSNCQIALQKLGPLAEGEFPLLSILGSAE